MSKCNLKSDKIIIHICIQISYSYPTLAINHDIKTMLEWNQIFSSLWKRSIRSSIDEKGSYDNKFSGKDNWSLHRILFSAITSTLSCTSYIDATFRMPFVRHKWNLGIILRQTYDNFRTSILFSDNICCLPFMVT